MGSGDVVWVILDSVSFAATPFAPEGPNTMPKLSALASEEGVVYTRAYSPGPASPSAHGSMFTNRLPSTTGTHEASPGYDGRFETIAGTLSERPSLLVSPNPFLFDGLDADFDVTVDLGGRRRGDTSVEWSVEEDATESVIEEVSSSDFVPPSAPDGDERFRNAGHVNACIDRFRKVCDGESFVVANYMDAHPPYVPTSTSLDQFAGDRANEDLPIGVPGHELPTHEATASEFEKAATTTLYHATVHDLDMEVAPLIRDFLGDGTAVIVTADHGNWVDSPLALDEQLINVPLIVFAPDYLPETVDYTVSIRDLPSTTMDILGRENPFPGESVLDVSGDRKSVSESIHEVGAETPVAVENSGVEIQHDIVAIEGDTRVKRTDGTIERQIENPTSGAILERTVRELSVADPRSDEQPPQYDDATLERLEDLGYRF